jgi:polysaccharide pyruvyl transferase WcaK-like protein
MALLGKMNVFLGMRLHSIIFALKMGVPALAISYSPKVSDFMKMVSQEKLCIPVERLDSNIATEKMMNICDNRTNIIETMYEEVQNLTRRTELNLNLARKLLDGCKIEV